MTILGIHDGHNASVALVAEGEVVFALQEERVVGEKNFTGFPREALRVARVSLVHIYVGGCYRPVQVNWW